MTKNPLSRLAQDYLWIALGSVLYSLSFDWFYVPNQIGFGGLTALGMILNHLSPAVPIGTVVLILNIPIFILGWKFLGGHTLVSSLFAMAATSVLVDLISAVYTFPPMDPMLAAIFGGVSLGLSLGIIFSKGATTGGTDLIARLLKLPFAWLPMGKLLLVHAAGGVGGLPQYGERHVRHHRPVYLHHGHGHGALRPGPIQGGLHCHLQPPASGGGD